MDSRHTTSLIDIGHGECHRRAPYDAERFRAPPQHHTWTHTWTREHVLSTCQHAFRSRRSRSSHVRLPIPLPTQSSLSPMVAILPLHRTFNEHVIKSTIPSCSFYTHSTRRVHLDVYQSAATIKRLASRRQSTIFEDKDREWYQRRMYRETTHYGSSWGPSLPFVVPVFRTRWWHWQRSWIRLTSMGQNSNWNTCVLPKAFSFFSFICVASFLDMFFLRLQLKLSRMCTW